MIQCPKCKSVEVTLSKGSGPHAAAARCSSCKKFWWVKRDDLIRHRAEESENEIRS